MQVGEWQVDGTGGVSGQGNGRFVGTVSGILQANLHEHVLRHGRQHRELDAVAAARTDQAVGELIAQNRLAFTGIEDVASGCQWRVAGKPGGLHLGRHAAVLLREQHEAFETLPVDV